MDLPDILSDEEMTALESQASSSGSSSGGGLSFDFSGGLPDVLSDEQMTALESQGSSKGWNFTDSLKQFGAGAAEGLGTLGGFLSDINPMKGIGDVVRARGEQLGIFDKQLTKQPYDYWRASKQINEGLDKILPAEDPQYHTARTMGEFIGPSMVGPGSAALKLASGAGGALGQLEGEKLTKNSTGTMAKAVPIGLSVLGAMSPSILSGGAKSIWSALVPASDDAVTGSAGQILRDATGLNGDDISAAINRAPKDELGKLMTTAEVTDNAGMAQIEKQLASTGQRAQAYSELGKQREEVRQGLIDSMSEVQGVNKEGLGSSLIEAADKTKESMSKNAENLWKQLPRDVEINIIPQQAEIASILESKQAGLMPRGDAKNILQQFITAKDGKLTSGALQDLRSDALATLRDKNLSFIEKRALSGLQSSIDDAMESQLNGGVYDNWLDARAATKSTAETFKQGTAGGSLLDDRARPSKVLANAVKGDTKSIQELRAAIAEQPELIESVKRGVLDMIPTNAQGELTPNGVKKFLAANDGAVKELFGEEHYTSLYRISEDLQSEARVQTTGFRASKGNSVTSQKNTVAGFIEAQTKRAGNQQTGIIGRAISALWEGTQAKNQDAIVDVLFKAALDPDVALQLASRPTESRVLSILDIIKQTSLNATREGVKNAGVQGLQNNERHAESGLTQGSQGKEAQYALESPLAQKLYNPGSSELQKTSLGSQPFETENKPTSANPNKGKQLPQEQSAQTSNTPDDEFISKLMDAIKYQESRGRNDAVSPKGARGPYQLMPATAKSYGVSDPHDPIESRRGATQLILDEWKALGDLRLALASYNAGRPAVLRQLKKVGGDSYEDIAHLLPKETREYVPSIEKIFAKLMQS